MSAVDTAMQPPSLRSWRQHVLATLKLGLPLVGAQIAQMLISTTDTVMIGWLGARELAASVLASQSFFIAMIFGLGFALAIQPIIAQAQGSGDERAARRAARMGFWIATFYAAILMIPLWNLERILIALGQEADIAAMAGGYTRIMQWSLFPVLYALNLRSFLSALEHPRIVLVATIAAAVANGFANYALIFGNWGAPALGLPGAAIASVVSTMASFVLLVGYCLLKREIARYEIHVRLWRADWPVFFEVLQLGWPISLTLIAEVGLFVMSSIMMGWIGAIELAAHGIALQLASLVFMVPLGLSSVATIRVGQAYGRREPDNLHRAAIVCLLLAIAVALCGVAAFTLVPRQLVQLFLDRSNPNALELIAYAVPLLAVAASFQLVDGIQAVAAGLLRGLKDTRIPMAMAVFSYWGAGMPLAYFLGIHAGYGGVGIWAGLAVGLAFAAVALSIRFFRLAGGLRMAG